MSKHDYTPQEALRRLIDKLAARDGQLATQVLTAVNAGRDVQEVERHGKRNSRFYRHTVPYTPEEALGIALEVLEAHFIEQPEFINSCHKNMVPAALGPSEARFPNSILGQKSEPVEGVGAEKTVEIELQTETEIIPTDTALSRQRQETVVMRRVPEAEIRQEKEILDLLRRLTDFAEAN